jgi:hypothetical protein
VGDKDLGLAGFVLNLFKIQLLYMGDSYMAIETAICFVFNSPASQHEVTFTLVNLVTVPLPDRLDFLVETEATYLLTISESSTTVTRRDG